MKVFLFGYGVVVALAVACGQSDSSSNEASTLGGTGAGGAADAGAPTDGGLGGAGDDNPGGAPGEAGTSGEGGASSDGGTASGSGGAPSSGGTSGSGGTPSNGGAPGTGGFSGCACQPLEACWEGSRCIPQYVSIGAYAIDATEVTRRQYTTWLATEPSLDGQRDECAWNDSYEPDATCMASEAVCRGNGCSDHPQPCVDFCDAAAYCSAAGKRLCGRIGTGPISFGSATDPFSAQWHNACTSDGNHSFTYGDALQSSACNDATRGAASTLPVASQSGCRSPEDNYRGVFDLIGNVWEWEDNCLGTDGAADICNPRGGSYGISAAAPNCLQMLPVERTHVSENVGFRCCLP